MSDSMDDFRGSTPIYTAKEILQALDRTVKDMDLKMDGFIMSLQIIVSQNLNERVQGLESEAKKIEGMGNMLKLLFGANAMVFVITVYTLLNSLSVGTL